MLNTNRQHSFDLINNRRDNRRVGEHRPLGYGVHGCDREIRLFILLHHSFAVALAESILSEPKTGTVVPASGKYPSVPVLHGRHESAGDQRGPAGDCDLNTFLNLPVFEQSQRQRGSLAPDRRSQVSGSRFGGTHTGIQHFLCDPVPAPDLPAGYGFTHSRNPVKRRGYGPGGLLRP